MNNPWIDMVKEFHQKHGQPVRTGRPNISKSKFLKEEELRHMLIEEEFKEWWDAWVRGDRVEMADALADMIYVIIGTALVYGFDLDALFKEVHRSNMSKDSIKSFEDGRVTKVGKGENYSPPDIEGVMYRVF